MPSARTKMYEIEVLPSARRDMVAVVSYISHELSNPAAAYRLANEMYAAMDSLAAFPYTNVVFQTIRPLKHDYRRLKVGNYLIFYHVDEDKKLVTVSRVIYARRDYKKMMSNSDGKGKGRRDFD